MWATATEKKTGPRFGSVRSYGFFRSYRPDLQTLLVGGMWVRRMGTPFISVVSTRYPPCKQLLGSGSEGC
jgi:hypothetical protein